MCAIALIHLSLLSMKHFDNAVAFTVLQCLAIPHSKLQSLIIPDGATFPYMLVSSQIIKQANFICSLIAVCCR